LAGPVVKAGPVVVEVALVVVPVVDVALVVVPVVVEVALVVVPVVLEVAVPVVVVDVAVPVVVLPPYRPFKYGVTSVSSAVTCGQSEGDAVALHWRE